mgnify:CR=1 FL=1
MDYLYNKEAEEIVLGSCFENDNILPIVLGTLDRDDFYFPSNSIVFNAIREIYNKDNKIRIEGLIDYLKQKETLDRIGGVSYIMGLYAKLESPRNIEYYCKMIKEKTAMRNLNTVCIQTTNKIKNCVNTEKLLGEVEQEIMNIKLYREEVEAENITPILERFAKIMDERVEKQSHLVGLSTGLEEVDNLTLGFQDKQMIVIASRPSMGKSALGLNMAVNLAIKKEIPVAFFSLEDSKIRITNRILSSLSRVNSNKIRTGLMSQDEREEVLAKMSYAMNKPLYIADVSYLNNYKLMRVARRYKKTKDIKIIFVDYLQLMSGKQDQNREREVSSISHALKAIAKELSIPVVALAQLNRNPLHRIPQLSDLRESGAIEQDADVVIFIYRPNINQVLTEDNETCQLIVAKQKDGSPGKIDVIFHKKYLQFSNRTTEELPF